ncbi:AI-2E family transporter [Paenibacillus koleovorans]|uniref:AI-2E family transporter n=1 Tax=Paenibacillus koleovorans TaxID=121608 RepID=UPI000FD74F46|nr:AI-2E family transporter [Paenibacillus koleovorans]
MDKILKSRLFAWLAYLLLILLALFLLQQLKPMLSATYGFLKAVLAPFLIAIIISYVLNPIVNMLSARKVPRTMAVLLIYIVFIACVVVVLMNLIPMFIKQLRELNEHMPDLTMRAQGLYDGLNDNRLIPESVRVGLEKALLKLEDNFSRTVSEAVGGIGSTISLMLVAFIVPFLAFYMLKDFQLFERAILRFVPAKHRKSTVKLVKDIDTALGHYVRGQFIVCVMIGLLAYIGYWIIDMPYALLLASIVAVFNIIPYMGPFFGAAPAIIMATTISLKMVVLVAIVNLLCQILEGNVISPQVVGRSLHLHPMAIIFALLVGGELAGVVGLILAVPCLAVLKVAVHHLIAYFVQRKTT